MKAQEILVKMTSTEFTHDVYQWNEGVEHQIIGSGFGRLCSFDNRYMPTSQCEANAEAICNAVNNTYGKGIDPACVSELLKRLQMLSEFAQKVLTHPKGSHGYQLEDSVNLQEQIKKAQLAIEKATLTHSLTSKTV